MALFQSAAEQALGVAASMDGSKSTQSAFTLSNLSCTAAHHDEVKFWCFALALTKCFLTYENKFSPSTVMSTSSAAL